MKFLIVLALVFTVSSAAFTGSLLHQTQPLLNQIKAELSVNLHARSSAEVGFQTEFIAAIQGQIQNILAEIQTNVDHLQVVGQNIAAQLQVAVAQIQTAAETLIANAQVAAQNFAQQIQAILASLFAGSSSRDFSALVQHLQDLVSQINLQTVLHNAVIQVFGEEFGGQLLALLGQNNKGLWGNIWGSITDVAGNIWDTVSGGAVSLANMIANVSSNVWNSVTDKFQAIKDIAQSIVSGGINVVTSLGQAAAQQVVNNIASVNWQAMGPVAINAVIQLLNVYSGLNIPPALLSAVLNQIG